MSKVYTTEELIKILVEERQACLNGQRLNLTAKASGNPVVDMLLKPHGIQKFRAYQDFKVTVHRYQRENQVSGIVWHQITVKGKTLQIPELDAQLIALPNDIEILKAAKDSMLRFWHEVTIGMELYLIVNNAKDHRLIAIDDVGRISYRTQWAGLCKWEKSDFLEIVLQLGWGKPEEAAYKRGWPDSGSDYIHAVLPGNLPTY